MKVISSKRVSDSWSDKRSRGWQSRTCAKPGRSIQNPRSLFPTIENPKSKIQNVVVGLLAIAFTFTFGGVVAQAQQPKKVPRIGYLSPGDAAGDSIRREAIRLALRERGYIEGQNIATEYRYAEGKRDRYPELAAELARLKVDLILVAGADPLVQAAKNATKAIPIVMTGGGADPVDAGLVDSLARPGGNVTGITNLTRELGGKRLELLKEAAPKIVRVAVLYDPNAPSSGREMKEVLPVAARALKLTLHPWDVRAADGFEKVFAALNKQRPDGIYVAGGEGQDDRFMAAFRALEAYDPAANRWTTLPRMPIPRHGLAGAVIGKRLHLVSGDVQSAGLAGMSVHSDAHDAFEFAD